MGLNRNLIILGFCLMVYGCSTTTMTVTGMGADGTRETKVYSKYYSSVDWVVDGKVGLEIWIDHEKKVGPLYPLQRSLGMLGPSDLYAKGIVTGYFVNLDESPKQITDFQVVYGRSNKELVVDSVIDLPGRAVTKVLPGNVEISNYGTKVELKVEFLIDGVAHSIPLTANRLTYKEMDGIRESFPWFQEPHYPFYPPLSQNF